MSFQERARLATELLSRQQPVTLEMALKQVRFLKAQSKAKNKKERQFKFWRLKSIVNANAPKPDLDMETTKKEKQFDAVRMMREIRDKIGNETQNMSFDELKEYIRKKFAESNQKLVGQK